MAGLRTTFCLGILAAAAALQVGCVEAQMDPRPNILLILSDDMGFSDLRCYGGEIDTPHLDALARRGIRFTEFYSTARCWPTRATLLSGRYSDSLGNRQVSIAEVLSYEDIGFVEKGKASKFIEDGEPFVGGSIPINTDGGLKLGHPVGATGIKQIIEITKQLRGKAINQIKGAKVGLTHNIGGSGATALVHLLGKD